MGYNYKLKLTVTYTSNISIILFVLVFSSIFISFRTIFHIPAVMFRHCRCNRYVPKIWIISVTLSDWWCSHPNWISWKALETRTVKCGLNAANVGDGGEARFTSLQFSCLKLVEALGWNCTNWCTLFVGIRQGEFIGRKTNRIIARNIIAVSVSLQLAWL